MIEHQIRLSTNELHDCFMTLLIDLVDSREQSSEEIFKVITTGSRLAASTAISKKRALISKGVSTLDMLFATMLNSSFKIIKVLSVLSSGCKKSQYFPISVFISSKKLCLEAML